MNKKLTKYRLIKIATPSGNSGVYYIPLNILFDDASSVKGYIKELNDSHQYYIEEVTLEVRDMVYTSQSK